MKSATTELTEQAQSIFSQLGYTVVGDGQQFRAERDWKVVQVTATANGVNLPESGSLHCFVTPTSEAERLRQQLRDRDPDYEWAVISVDEEQDDYSVERAPPGPRHDLT